MTRAAGRLRGRLGPLILPDDGGRDRVQQPRILCSLPRNTRGVSGSLPGHCRGIAGASPAAWRRVRGRYEAGQKPEEQAGSAKECRFPWACDDTPRRRAGKRREEKGFGGSRTGGLRARANWHPDYAAREATPRCSHARNLVVLVPAEVRPFSLRPYPKTITTSIHGRTDILSFSARYSSKNGRNGVTRKVTSIESSSQVSIGRDGRSGGSILDHPRWPDIDS